jgi:ABC-2 type transport system ATP-binding protein
MASVEELCDNIALINNSEKILEGNVQDIKKGSRTNTYEISFTGNGNISNMLPPGCKMVSQSTDEGSTIVRIMMEGNGNPNVLLKSLMPNVEIHGFREILPTMNDIFIATVNADKK